MLCALRVWERDREGRQRHRDSGKKEDARNTQGAAFKVRWRETLRAKP